jgi:hypothetical protein
MEVLFVLTPPVAIVLKAWFIASNGVIPAAHRQKNSAMVRPMYVNVITLTVLPDLYL